MIAGCRRLAAGAPAPPVSAGNLQEDGNPQQNYVKIITYYFHNIKEQMRRPGSYRIDDTDKHHRPGRLMCRRAAERLDADRKRYPIAQVGRQRRKL